MTIPLIRSDFSKRGVSLMLSYVLLISLAILMAVTVYASLKLIANVKPVASCESGTSIIITSYTCTPGSPIFDPVFSLTFENNGFFSVKGVIVSISDDDNKIPVTPVNAKDPLLKRDTGVYVFPPPLVEPGQTYTANLEVNTYSTTSSTIKQVRIQPFIINEKQDLVVCGDAALIEKLVNCVIR